MLLGTDLAWTSALAITRSSRDISDVGPLFRDGLDRFQVLATGVRVSHFGRFSGKEVQSC
jgi:hypothetical protein